MMTSSKKEKFFILAFILFVFAAFAAILIIPASRDVFNELSANHPYIMGFVKFALLATAGELISVRLAVGSWRTPSYIIIRLIIWGLIGVWITYMMKIFFLGTDIMMSKGLLPGGNIEGVWKSLLHALFTSMTMNLAFGPTFMALHKCSDTYLALRAERGVAPKLDEVIQAIDWKRFVSFTLLRTVPVFWIPAHTVTFMLPAEYQVMLAALLSVALGIILNLRKKSK